MDKREIYPLYLKEIRQSPPCQRIRRAMFPYLAQKFIAEIDYWAGHSEDEFTATRSAEISTRRRPMA
ncbi:hypothetical protein JJC00_07370 [Bradyrhizobium diazoefficiens]|uniref:hypothetical protein n=1 Tax=Bradyrhizobium diazoefficiens TaxID=1355477 RepID=UPI00190E3F8F|nr:hypothetical protein [Bradyrhizobium diazoefficiens]QQO35463.1 hypothetical protein JJC00_07370 [Bradyrhizobium diazoefficiens]